METALFYKLRKKLGRSPTEIEIHSHIEEMLSNRRAKDALYKRELRKMAKSDPELKAKLKALKSAQEARRMVRVLADPARLQKHKETRRINAKSRMEKIRSNPSLMEEARNRDNMSHRNSYAIRRANDPEFVEYHRKRTRDYFNTEKGREIRRETMSRLRRESPAFRIASYIRTRISGAIRNGEKFGRSVDLLGCSFDDYKSYLESLFEPGMSWDNYGNKEGYWSIDHKVPIAAHDISTESGQKKAFHYTNTKPSWHNENLCKNSIYNGRRWYYRDHMPAPVTV